MRGGGEGGMHPLYTSEVWPRCTPSTHGFKSWTQVQKLKVRVGGVPPWVQKLHRGAKARGVCGGGVHPLYTWVQRADEIPVCEVSEV